MADARAPIALPDQACGPAPDDRGLLYGDGVFRTFRHGPNGVWDRDAQFGLLARDCRLLGIAPPARELLDAAVAQAVARCPAAQQVVRITVTRGSGPRGYRPPPDAQAAVHVSAAEAPALCAWDAGYRMRICTLRLGHQPRLAGAKHLNRLENVLARAEWDDPAIDDGVLLGQAGEVVESTMANLFWRSGDTAFAPALNRAGVAGRQRSRILEALRQAGANVIVGHFSLGTLTVADEVWVCNSVIGVRAVTELDGRALKPGDTTREIAAALFADWQPRQP